MRPEGFPDTICQLHLGPATTHTVYKGELISILLAISMLSTYQIRARAIIFTDNQAALLALQAGHSRPDSYILDEILS